MARRSRKRPWGEHRPLRMDSLASMPRAVSRPDGDFQVQHLSQARKTYVCPGCSQEIQIGQAHVVAWRTDSIFGTQAGLDQRRHWHRSCWERGL
ncbi:ATP/GTP-binding protein [Varibaculum cambriense]|uniref:ATP/GTP-binding protein n=2 Tax=Varibaculum cambriense TaxID=184870 RepID=A0AAJ1EUR9_9ACTO|nr:ATP/GTP-binding protein [Varibaculum cambriense]